MVWYDYHNWNKYHETKGGYDNANGNPDRIIRYYNSATCVSKLSACAERYRENPTSKAYFLFLNYKAKGHYTMSTVTDKTDVDAQADAAVAESKENKKKDRKKGSGKGRKPKKPFSPIPDEGFTEGKVDGFDSSVHQPLTVADFGGNEVVFIEHQIWLHECQIEVLNKRKAAIEKFDPAVRSGMLAVLRDVSKLESGYSNVKNGLKESKLSADEQKQQDDLIDAEIENQLKAILARRKARQSS